MGRFFGFVVFLLAAIGVILFFTSRSGLDLQLPNASQTAANDNVDIASKQKRAVASIDNQVERAINLAENAEDLANDLEQAADRAEENADALLQLASTNEAAEVSVVTSMEAAERARATAVIARRAANQLMDAATYADDAVDEAEEVTGVVLAVERRKEKADEAVQEAREAEEEALEAERAVDNITAEADVYIRQGQEEDYYQPTSYTSTQTSEYRTVRRDRDGRVLESIEDIMPEEDDEPSEYDYAELGENG